MWFQFVMGVLALVTGILVIRYRVRVARWQARAYRSVGGWGAESAAQNLNPGTMLVVGSVGVIVGVCLIVTAVVRLTGGS